MMDMGQITFDNLPAAIAEISISLAEVKTLLINFGKNSTVNSIDLLDIHGAAEILGLALPTMYAKVSRNEIPYMKKSKRLYFSKNELIAYLESGRKKTDAEIAQENDTYLSTLKKGK